MTWRKRDKANQNDKTEGGLKKKTDKKVQKTTERGEGDETYQEETLDVSSREKKIGK